MHDVQRVANVEAQHNQRCSSYDGCGCFERLLALIRGEPDPEGEFYRWPVLNFDVREPRLAEWEAMGRTEFTTFELMSEAMKVSAEETMHWLVDAGPPSFQLNKMLPLKDSLEEP